MMRSSSGDLEGALRVRLAADIGEVDWKRNPQGDLWAGTGRLSQGGPFFPMRLQVAQVIDAEHRRRGRDAGLGDVGGRHVKASHPQAVKVRRDGEGAADRTDRAIEGQLTEPGRV